MVLCLQRKTLDAPLAAVGLDLRAHNMFEERPDRCHLSLCWWHLSALVKRRKRKFSSSPTQVWRLPSQPAVDPALKSWTFARSLFPPCSLFSPPTTFARSQLFLRLLLLLHEGSPRKKWSLHYPDIDGCKLHQANFWPSKIDQPALNVIVQIFCNFSTAVFSSSKILNFDLIWLVAIWFAKELSG